MTELFTTGKTKNKVTGFTSKAGNVFDACLKYENEQITFDFDNPGESRPEPQTKQASDEAPKELPWSN
jgi:DNA topoisomerase-3